MNRRELKRGLLSAALGAAILTAGALLPAVAVAAGAALPGKVVLPEAPPHIPAGVAHLGSAPSDQVLNLAVALAGQNPSGLAQAVAAVTTPGSPDYRHYVTSAQFAAAFGPSTAEVAQVSSVLRSEGLTVGAPAPGSSLLPVRGTVSAVSAAFATPLESVQVPHRAASIVNTAAPQVPAALAGAVTGVVGLDGLAQQHSMARRAPAPTSSTSQTSNATGAAGATSQSHALVAHVGPQACGAAQNRANGDGGYTSTQMASIYGLNTLLGQGRTGLGQTIGIVEFDRYAPSDVNNFMSCYGLSNPINNVLVDGGPPPPSSPDPEPAIDIELAAVTAPSASLTVYEAPNSNTDATGIDLYNRIASDDTAQVVTTSWGDCEADLGSSDFASENTIFSRMAMQGQTVIAASGDAGSEDCFFPPNDVSTTLAVDDPGSQPFVISGGGTSLPSASASSQFVWNDCYNFTLDQNIVGCGATGSSGAGGGGYSMQWPLNPGQTAPSGSPSGTDPCANAAGCRAVPDISGSADPAHGVPFYFGQDGGWTTFGGTSIVAPSNAGFFADTNQGCFRTLGGVGQALYTSSTTPANFFDVTGPGNNDLTDTNGGDFAATAGFDAASGLGTPNDQNLFKALQGGDGTGCPSVTAVSPNTGPLSGSGAITISGGGFQDATSVTFGSAGPGQILSRSDTTLTVIPPNASAPLCVDVTVRNALGISAISSADHFGFGGDLNCGQGYRLVASDGGIFDYGTASFWGSTGNLKLNAPVVGMAATQSTNGYWLVASDGGIFNYGDAGFFGSMGGQHLNRPIVGMAAGPGGNGYWLVASDGGIFSFGSAHFFGSTGGMNINKPIVGMAATPDGGGYWLVASDGGIFAYGDAQFDGSTGAIQLNQPVVGMAAGPGGNGYWLVASDGGIFTFGSASFHGSAGAIHLNQPVVGMAATPDGNGYWLVASDGGIFTYGDALFFGSTGNIHLNKPIVGMSST